MIHVFVGTKAQFIKMVPIMQELQAHDVHYNFIDAGQHSDLTSKLITEFELRQPDVRLRKDEGSITTFVQALGWFMISLLRILFNRQMICHDVFLDEKGVCLIHGDTLTTLLSLLYAKRCGLRVAHVEAGLRSFSLLNPFPEEIIRLIAMRFSDLLFAPSEWAFQNLVNMGYGEKAILTDGNTIVDTVRYAQERIDNSKRPSAPYVVVTVHRVETIYSRVRMEFLIDLLEHISKSLVVIFVLHQPTEGQLRRFDLWQRLVQASSIRLLPLMPYLSFIGLISGSEFVITDGGSIQEETAVLGVPCLIMRTKTERKDGLDRNVVLSQFDWDQIEEFLRSVQPQDHHVEKSGYPSKLIVQYLREYTRA